MNTAFIGKLAIAAVTANSVRLPEFENYYDTLIGFGSNASDVSNIDALGSMVDEAIVSYSEDGLLTIYLVRNF